MRQSLKRMFVFVVFAMMGAMALPVAHASGKTFRTPAWLVTYGGLDLANDSYYVYSGAVMSLQRDLTRSGYVLRAYSAYGKYDYTAPSSAKIDAERIQADAMIGYLHIKGPHTLGTFVGIDFQRADLSPIDPANPIDGRHVGAKIVAQYRHYSPKTYVSLQGQYSTALDTYWTQARVGINGGRFIVGPEIVATGNDAYDMQRYGAFIMSRFYATPQVPVQFTMSMGYQAVSDGNANAYGRDGLYGTMNFTIAF